MADIVLDACVLSDFLAQYFGLTNRGMNRFSVAGRLCKDAVYHINRIRTDHECGRLRDVVVASALSFVEVVRAWRKIDGSQISAVQLAAFFAETPDWFSIAPLNEELAEHLLNVPPSVVMPSGKVENIELFDAIHVATAISRGEESLLVTSDQKIREIPEMSGRILCS